MSVCLSKNVEWPWRVKIEYSTRPKADRLALMQLAVDAKASSTIRFIDTFDARDEYGFVVTHIHFAFKDQAEAIQFYLTHG